MNIQAKDLTKEAPRSPKTKVGGYVILGRTIDKCRALLWGNIGEYHFDCPLDNMLFGWKGIKGDDFIIFSNAAAQLGLIGGVGLFSVSYRGRLHVVVGKPREIFVSGIATFLI